MRRRLEKWSQGWVTPSGRNQPRQRPAGSLAGSKSSISSTSDAGTESVERSASSPAAPAQDKEADGFFMTAPPRMEAPPVNVEEMAVLADNVLCCCHPRHGSLTQEAAAPDFVRCKLRLSEEVLHLQAAEDAALVILLNKVTDVSVLTGPRISEQMKDAGSEVLLLCLSSPVSRSSPGSAESLKDEIPSSWEVPPIPFGKLPLSRPGLPARWQVPAKIPAGRWLQGQPLGDFDRSNAQLHQHLSVGMLPLHASVGRLPPQSPASRQLPEDRRLHETAEWVRQRLQCLPSSCHTAVVVWVGDSENMARSSGRGCRLRNEGIPAIVGFADAADAAKAHQEILLCRAKRLGF
ncbi:unnamed protein product [Symbiodinium sp. CCMP2456]|nr:unnamed protein product [Symbiodinium sp. CCMP2456]